MPTSSTEIVYRQVAELPAGAQFTSVSLSRDLEGFDPSLVSACFRALKEDEMISEIAVGPGRTITYQRTAIPPSADRVFKSGPKAPRQFNRKPGYSCPNAGRPDLPRIAEGPAPRPDLEGRKIDRESLGEDPFPNADRLDATEKVEVTLDKPRVGPAKTDPEPAFPNFVKIGELLYPVGPLTADPEKRLSARLRRIADEVEAVEDAIAGLAKNLGVGS